MKKMRILLLFALIVTLVSSSYPQEKVKDLKFDHNHTFSEVAAYLQGMVEAYPKLAKLHTIGKSYLGKDLLVLEITNQETGRGTEKPEAQGFQYPWQMATRRL